MYLNVKIQTTVHVQCTLHGDGDYDDHNNNNNNNDDDDEKKINKLKKRRKEKNGTNEVRSHARTRRTLL